MVVAREIAQKALKDLSGVIGRLMAALARLNTLTYYLLFTFPRVTSELTCWEEMALRNPGQELKLLALASLKHKRFHCQGGSVFSVLAARKFRPQVLTAIVALQTISDYLDNLSDRAGIHDEPSLRQLHLAFTDALRPEAPTGDYYRYYPYKDDGGYLTALVSACRKALAQLPGYGLVQQGILALAEYYCTLQALKHLTLPVREERLRSWLEPWLAEQEKPLLWWELAAATGSTLGIFALMALATRKKVEPRQVAQLQAAYFPWICGLHILLDYYIDQQEDLEAGDLNFVAYYPEAQARFSRLQFFVKEALRQARALPESRFHETVVEGLLAMYLSDSKVASQDLSAEAGELLALAGWRARLLFNLCARLRRLGML
ncbi:MAG: tetraprenyl-beta-curcumene synthase [Clostridia bacterium]|nr:tetraprenyl-beta-curcumene synthase [Clostridia bacterium]